MIDLIALAESKKIQVEEVRMRNQRGFYQPELRLIAISSDLSQAQFTSTLAHELGHAFYNDHPTGCQRTHEFQERRATAWGALRIIDPYDYADAEDAHGPHPGAIAQQLDVTRELVEAWQTNYPRKGF